MNHNDLREGYYTFSGEFDASLYEDAHGKFVQQSNFKEGCGWLIDIPEWKTQRDPYRIEGTLKVEWFIEKQEKPTKESIGVEEFNLLFTNLQRVKTREKL